MFYFVWFSSSGLGCSICPGNYKHLYSFFSALTNGSEKKRLALEILEICFLILIHGHLTCLFIKEAMTILNAMFHFCSVLLANLCFSFRICSGNYEHLLPSNLRNSIKSTQPNWLYQLPITVDLQQDAYTFCFLNPKGMCHFLYWIVLWLGSNIWSGNVKDLF